MVVEHSASAQNSLFWTHFEIPFHAARYHNFYFFMGHPKRWEPNFTDFEQITTLPSLPSQRFPATGFALDFVLPTTAQLFSEIHHVAEYVGPCNHP